MIGMRGLPNFEEVRDERYKPAPEPRDIAPYTHISELVNVMVATMRHRRITMSQARVMVEQEYIRQALADSHGNQCKAALSLKIHRNSLRRLRGRK